MYSCVWGGWPSGPWTTSSSFLGAAARAGEPGRTRARTTRRKKRRDITGSRGKSRGIGQRDLLLSDDLAHQDNILLEHDIVASTLAARGRRTRPPGFRTAGAAKQQVFWAGLIINGEAGSRSSHASLTGISSFPCCRLIRCGVIWVRFEADPPAREGGSRRCLAVPIARFGLLL